MKFAKKQIPYLQGWQASLVSILIYDGNVRVKDVR